MHLKHMSVHFCRIPSNIYISGYGVFIVVPFLSTTPSVVVGVDFSDTWHASPVISLRYAYITGCSILCVLHVGPFLISYHYLHYLLFIVYCYAILTLDIAFCFRPLSICIHIQYLVLLKLFTVPLWYGAHFDTNWSPIFIVICWLRSLFFLLIFSKFIPLVNLIPSCSSLISLSFTDSWLYPLPMCSCHFPTISLGAIYILC